MKTGSNFSYDLLKQLVAEGKSGIEIAAIMKVSPARISQCKAKLSKDGRPKSLDKLTPGRQKFAALKAAGVGNQDAAMESFNCSSVKSASAMASQALASPDVQMAMKDILKSVGLSDTRCAEVLAKHVESEDSGASLKGLDMVMKIKGHYVPDTTVVVVDGKQISDELAVITKRMQEMGMFSEAGDIIDVTTESEQIKARETVDALVPVTVGKAMSREDINAEYERSLNPEQVPVFMSSVELNKPYRPVKEVKKKDVELDNDDDFIL